MGLRASDVNMVEVESARMNHPYLKAKTKNKKVGVFDEFVGKNLNFSLCPSSPYVIIIL